MIKINGKRVMFTNDKVKSRRMVLEVEAEKHKGKPVSALTKKEMEDALSAALKLLEIADDVGVIK